MDTQSELPELNPEDNTGFLLVHVNTILAIGVIFNGILLAVFLPTLENAYMLLMNFGGYDVLPVTTKITLSFRHLWFMGFVMAAAEVLLWNYLKRKLYLVYINTFLLIVSSSLSVLCSLTAYHRISGPHNARW